MQVSKARISSIFRFIAQMSERMPVRKGHGPQPDSKVQLLLDNNLQYMRLVGLNPNSRLDRTRFFNIEERFIAKIPGTIDQVFAVLIKRTSEKTFLGQFVREFKDAPQLDQETEEHYLKVITDPGASESEAKNAGYVIWRGHQKTIVELANEYIGAAEGALELIDLIEAGRVGLLESIKSCSSCLLAIEQAVAEAARQGRRIKKEDLPDEFFDPPSEEDQMIDSYLHNKEESERLEMVLPQIENIILTLLCEEGLSFKEAAERLKLRLKYVEKIGTDALRKRQESSED